MSWEAQLDALSPSVQNYTEMMAELERYTRWQFRTARKYWTRCASSMLYAPFDERRLNRSTLLQTEFLPTHRTTASNGSSPSTDQAHLSNPLLNDTRAPAYWVHVPKSGSSFVNTFLHSPAVCRKWPSCAVFKAHDMLADFLDAYPHYMYCPGAISRPLQRSHQGVGVPLPAGGERLVIMLRQPEQRLLSRWYNGMQSFRQAGLDFAAIAARSRGCVTRILTRSSVNACEEPPAATEEESRRAISRLSSDFAFVGIVEHWALSVCLFNVMSGRESMCPTANAVQQTRESSTEAMLARNGSQKAAYDTRVLEGRIDIFDGTLYEVGERIFRRNLVAHGVSREECFRVCNLPASR